MSLINYNKLNVGYIGFAYAGFGLLSGFLASILLEKTKKNIKFLNILIKTMTLAILISLILFSVLIPKANFTLSLFLIILVGYTKTSFFCD